MSFFTNMRADRLIAEIKAADDSDDHRESLEKLARLGPSAVPRILDALASADKRETTGFVAVLTALLDDKTFPLVAAGLTEGNQRTVAGAAAALSGACFISKLSDRSSSLHVARRSTSDGKRSPANSGENHAPASSAKSSCAVKSPKSPLPFVQRSTVLS